MSDYIAKDILVLILKRLSVTTLLRCRCVCKLWKELIGSNSFVVDHLTIQNPRIIAQSCNLEKYIVFDPHTFPLLDTFPGPITVKRQDRTRYGFTLSSLHGVICVYNNGDTLLLWNPSIRKVLRIPLPELPIFCSSDYTIDFRYCGFWIDPSNNNFKIVVFCLETRSAVVFSSKEQVWMEVGMGDMEHYWTDTSSPQVMIDGVAHWISYAEGLFELGDIFFFDFEQHKFGGIKLPPDMPTISKVNLCKWKGFLSVAYHESIFLQGCSLWAMQNGSWCNMFRIRLPRDIIHVFCVMDSSGRVLASNERCRLLVHDPKDGFIRLNTSLRGVGMFIFSYDFVESLVFPEQNCISSDQIVRV